MDQYQDNRILSNPSLRDRARGALTGRFGQAVLAFFLAWLISFGARFLLSFLLTFAWSCLIITKEVISAGMSLQVLAEIMEDSTRLSSYYLPLNLADLVLTMGISVYTGVFKVGLSLYTLNLACGRQAVITNIFYGFNNHFRKSLHLSAAYTLTQWIFLLPANLCFILKNQEASATVIMICAALTAGGFVLSCCLLLHISQCFFLMLDFPGYSAGELLRLSVRIMEGHKKRLLMLILGFIPLYLFAALTFGIALLWVVPYTEAAMAFFFLNLIQARNQN